MKTVHSILADSGYPVQFSLTKDGQAVTVKDQVLEGLKALGWTDDLLATLEEDDDGVFMVHFPEAKTKELLDEGSLHMVAGPWTVEVETP